MVNVDRTLLELAQLGRVLSDPPDEVEVDHPVVLAVMVPGDDRCLSHPELEVVLTAPANTGRLPKLVFVLIS